MNINLETSMKIKTLFLSLLWIGTLTPMGIGNIAGDGWSSQIEEAQREARQEAEQEEYNRLRTRLNELTQERDRLVRQKESFTGERETLTGNIQNLEQQVARTQKNLERSRRISKATVTVLRQNKEKLERTQEKLEDELSAGMNRSMIHKFGVSPKDHIFRNLLRIAGRPIPNAPEVGAAEQVQTDGHTHELHKRIIGEGLGLDNGKIVLISVHGTFATPNAFGLDDSRLTTQQILRLAQTLALAHKKPVELLIFKWSGALKQEDRINAGETLAGWLQPRMLHDKDISEIWTIAHSHGCNVVNNMADRLKELAPNRPIDVGIQIASPKLDKPLFNPDNITEDDMFKQYNFDNLYHFYSTGDNIQVGGSLEESPYRGLFSLSYYSDRKLPMPILTDNDRRVYNIRIQDGNFEPDHILIKMPVLANITNLLFIIDTEYSGFWDLDAAVFIDPLMEKYPEKLGPLRAAIEKNNKDGLKTPIMVIRNRESLQQGSLSLDKIKKALRYSNGERENYKRIYDGEDIGAKRSHGFLQHLTGEWYSSNLPSL